MIRVAMIVMNHVDVIAEIGVNHNGCLELALRLVDEAKKAGADYVKFQTFVPERIVSASAGKADYQRKTTGRGSQLEMLSRLALTRNEFVEIKKYCDAAEVCFLSTPFDEHSIAFLDELGVPFWKVPSGEVTNYPYLVSIAKTGKPIVMSTGMCELSEIGDALNTLRMHGAGKVTLLQCTTEYPAPYQEVNLRAMETLRKTFACEVGYSDHTLGVEIPIAAAAMGATVIEKHFTLNRNMEGPDHRASLEPDELAAMVSAIRIVEQALGDGVKTPSDSERKNMTIARKSIVALRDISAGELLTEENVTTKRPGSGISPMRWNEVMGTYAVRDFAEDELITI